MKKVKLLLCVVFMLALVGCGKNRNKLMEGTYIYSEEDTVGEFIIVHKGNDVSIKINGQEYEAEIVDFNQILVDGQYTILENFCDSDGNSDIENCAMDRIRILDAKEWIEGDYEVNREGTLILELDKQ